MRRSCEDEGEDQSDAATSKEHLEPPEAERGDEELSPGALGGTMALSAASFQTSGCQN